MLRRDRNPETRKKWFDRSGRHGRPLRDRDAGPHAGSGFRTRAVWVLAYLSRNRAGCKAGFGTDCGGRLASVFLHFQPPLTAPAVNPATIWRCANTVSSSTGKVTISAAAASGPQLSWSKEIML